MKKNIAFIFARGGSKGLPRKNVKMLCGKPLIAYSIEAAQQTPLIDSVYVSTEDEEIASVSRQFGAEIIMRPKRLAQDHSPEWSAWQHAIEVFRASEGDFDLFVSLPATSPFRSVEDIDDCILSYDINSDIVITVQDAVRSPYFNMVTRNADGISRLIIEDAKAISRRQDAPKSYDVTTVAYVAAPDFILENENIFSGRVKSVIIPAERAIDIDTPLDFKFAELLMTESKC